MSTVTWFYRACERLKQMRIKQARPDPEKAAKTQELHRKLRVCLHNILKTRRFFTFYIGKSPWEGLPYKNDAGAHWKF